MPTASTKMLLGTNGAGLGRPAMSSAEGVMSRRALSCSFTSVFHLQKVREYSFVGRQKHGRRDNHQDAEWEEIFPLKGEAE